MKDSFYFLDAELICAVKELGSIDAVTKLLGITEKSLNVYIKRAEQRIGIPVFIRNTKQRSIELNIAGLEIYPICKGIISLKDVVKPLNHPLPSSEVRGEVKLTATQTILEYFHLPHLLSFMEEYPGVTINLNQLDDFYPVSQAINEVYFTVDIQNDTETFSYFPYHDFIQKLWASDTYLKNSPKLNDFQDLQNHTLLFQLGYLTSKVMGANKIKSDLLYKPHAGRSLGISGCRIVDRACELGLGIMNGSEETVSLSGMNVKRVLHAYESDALTMYVKVHRKLLEKQIGKAVMNWIFNCRDTELKSIGKEASYPYERLL